MQTTSALWRSLWAAGANVESRAVINGTTYTEISNPVINRALTQNGMTIGNAVSATCSFSVRTDAAIPKSAEVVIQFRLNDGTQLSEWLSAGTFYISHRQRDPVTGIVSLQCYDALLKANARMPALFPWTDSAGNVITTKGGEWLYFSATYPRRMDALAGDLARAMGVTIDPETTLATGDAYVIESAGASTTINEALCKIAAANGGNWIMTPANTLRLVPAISAAGAATATENVCAVEAIMGGIETSRTATVTGIRYNTDNGHAVEGDETGLVIDADVTQAIAGDLAAWMIGMTYQAYSLRGAIYDPAAELGDYVRGGANGEVRAVLCAEMATYGIAFRGDLSAPEAGELSDEYPYLGGNANLLEMANAYADAAAQQAAQTLDNTLTQQEVFDRLTGNGAAQGMRLESELSALGADTVKQLYFDADYVAYGYLNANRIAANSIAVGKLTGSIANGNWKIDLDAGTFTIGNISANNINTGTLSADRIAANSIAVSKLTGSISATATGGSTAWSINLTNGTLTIGDINANSIKAGTINGNNVNVTNLNASNITGGTLNCENIAVTNLKATSISGPTTNPVTGIFTTYRYYEQGGLEIEETATMTITNGIITGLTGYT